MLEWLHLMEISNRSGGKQPGRKAVRKCWQRALQMHVPVVALVPICRGLTSPFPPGVSLQAAGLNKTKKSLHKANGNSLFYLTFDI